MAIVWVASLVVREEIPALTPAKHLSSWARVGGAGRTYLLVAEFSGRAAVMGSSL